MAIRLTQLSTKLKLNLNLEIWLFVINKESKITLSRNNFFLKIIFFLKVFMKVAMTVKRVM